MYYYPVLAFFKPRTRLTVALRSWHRPAKGFETPRGTVLLSGARFYGVSIFV